MAKANHRKQTKTLRSLSKRQWTKIAAGVAAVVALVGGSVIAVHSHDARQDSVNRVTSYSATDANALGVSRGSDREDLRGGKAGDTYVTVKINGKNRAVVGSHFTDVKSVLDQGDITLETGDVVNPSLKTKVNESTVITIERADANLETSDAPIGFNVVTKETSDLPKGQQKVESEGQEGVMETTSLVTKAGKKTISSNVFTSFVKQAPVDKVILVGTGSNSPVSSAAANIGSTVPVGEMQQWAHDYLLSNGGSEADFTATVYIISHESGWRVNAQNPSGAYGLPQALPGNKMASAGADWATNYQTQLKWFWGYCARYGGVQGAYAHWLTAHSY
ncbi:G5 domain-containing protein [Bifidobacterium sp. ESL0784]|uniref:aggregation-promoting factor C-terminal-like domain-containing protein n=1 Tax=Bifidobacterium sp. ESL0784 TaxID=2983231 RepID=UPI0023F7DBF3|nr:G5 domain-containing protein [Bifidobacterium sp. ESL0784]MDF7640342.1 G5 domain-containing protein [Bifidobacterium sp. ESL0784]